MLSGSRLSTMLKYMYRSILFFMIFVGSNVGAAEVYMTVDENGNPVFSDQASEDAKKIEVKEVITIPGLTNTTPTTSSAEPVEYYQILSIANPKDDGTYFRSEGNINILVDVSPRLRGQDQIVYYLNGMRLHSGKSANFTLSELDRGTHTVSVSIIASDGEVIKTSDTITFHVRQASVLSR